VRAPLTTVDRAPRDREHLTSESNLRVTQAVSDQMVYNPPMRRLATLVLIVAIAGPSLDRQASAAEPGNSRGASTDASSAAAVGRRATARLLRDSGLELTGTGLPPHVLHAIVVDVDADGDDDLVANIGSLDLGVWINDGTGHLTRARAPEPGTSWAPVPPAPSFEAKTLHLEMTTPDNAPSIGPQSIRAGPAPSHRSLRLATSEAALPSASASPSSPRAPPLA
jgi:hypothetical protein